MEIGNKVKWTSQAGGNTKTKHGVVVAIVPALDRIHNVVRPFLNPGNIPKIRKYKEAFDAASYPRDHKSYVIEVPSVSGKGKSTLYWPRVSQLKFVEP